MGQTPVVLVATQGTVTVQDDDGRPGPAPYTLLDEEGRPWQVAEGALRGPEGERAPRLEGHLAYWFGWYAFFPNTLLYKGE